MSGSIHDLNTETYFVRRDTLTDELRDAHGIVLPEDRLDASEFPALVRAARASPLIQVEEGAWRAVLGAGARGCFFGVVPITDTHAFESESGRRLEITSEDFEDPLRGAGLRRRL